MEIVAARIDDLDAVQRLLQAGTLPLEGVRDQFPAAYWVACEQGRVIGAVGLEQYASHGLLRSLVVAEGAWRRRIGTALIQRALEFASTRLQAVFLLTTTAPDFFSRAGFQSFPRSEVPAEVARSPDSRASVRVPRPV
jgi:amino-acid N-acetyltransferase